MPDNSFDTFMAGLVADLKPVTPLKQRRGMALAMVALALGAALLVATLGLRRDFAAGHPEPMVTTAAGIFLVLAVASAWAVVDMVRPGVGLRRDGWGWTALMAAVLPGSALGLAGMDLWQNRPVTIDPGGVMCLGLGLGTGLITLAALVLWLRRGAPSSLRRAGMLAGVAAGAAGAFAVSLWCPHDNLMHIGVWHGATVVVMGLAGRWLLPRWIIW